MSDDSANASADPMPEKPMTLGDRKRVQHEETTRIAGDIMAGQKSAEDAKTARLREARIKRDKALSGSGSKTPSR